MASFRPETIDAVRLDDALAEGMTRALDQVRAVLPGVMDEAASSAIHQTRVALRRLRTILWLVRRLAPEGEALAWSDGVRRLADLLGPVRDWDVLVEETLPAAERLTPDIGGFDDLAMAARHRRAAALALAREEFEVPAEGSLLEAVRAWADRRGWRDGLAIPTEARLDLPATEFARPVLDRLRRQAIRAGRHLKRQTPEERHRARILLKRLRYAMEALALAFGSGRRFRAYTHTLTHLQDELGIDHDRLRTAELLRSLDLAEAAPEVHVALGGVLGGLAARARAHRHDLADLWTDFSETRPPWRA